MAAGAAGDDNLQVCLLAHRARVVGALFETAKTATRRGRALSCRLFVHLLRFTRASHFDLPKQRPCDSRVSLPLRLRPLYSAARPPRPSGRSLISIAWTRTSNSLPAI